MFASPVAAAERACAGLSAAMTLSVSPLCLANSAARSRSSPAAPPSGLMNQVVGPGRIATTNSCVGFFGAGGGGGDGSGPQAATAKRALHRMSRLDNCPPMDDALATIITIERGQDAGAGSVAPVHDHACRPASRWTACCSLDDRR